MTINYYIIGAVAFVVLLILAFAIYKNQKDKIKLEEGLNKEEMSTEHHKDGESQ